VFGQCLLKPKSAIHYRLDLLNIEIFTGLQAHLDYSAFRPRMDIQVRLSQESQATDTRPTRFRRVELLNMQVPEVQFGVQDHIEEKVGHIADLIHSPPAPGI